MRTGAGPTATPPEPLRDPEAITARSFALIREALGDRRLPPEVEPIALRVIHACGMVDVVDDLRWHGRPMAVAAALGRGAPVLCDARMVAAGIDARCRTVVTLDDPEVPALAARLQTTRSAAAVERWRPHLDGAVVAIGNAPTALFHLLDRLRTWPERPALILAFPVGFVGAAESKEALIEADLDVPWVTLRGRRGGSAMAAAAVNALIVRTP